jgi:predicted tellurium resistance membrane protein TerC
MVLRIKLLGKLLDGFSDLLKLATFILIFLGSKLSFLRQLGHLNEYLRNISTGAITSSLSL